MELTAGDKLAELRNLLGLDRTDFAALYSLDQETYANWEEQLESPEDYTVALLERCVIEDFQRIRKYKMEKAKKSMAGGFLDRPTLDEYLEAGCGLLHLQQHP